MAFVFSTPPPSTPLSLSFSNSSSFLTSIPSHSTTSRDAFVPSLFPSKTTTSMNVENANKQSSSSSSSPSSSSPKKISPKQLFQEYGTAYVLLSIGVSAVSISAWYVAVNVGVDVHQLALNTADFLDAHSLGRPEIVQKLADATAAAAVGQDAATEAADKVKALQSWLGPDVATKLVIAYLAHKLTSPFRFPVVIAFTPAFTKWYKKVTKQQATNE